MERRAQMLMNVSVIPTVVKKFATTTKGDTFAHAVMGISLTVITRLVLMLMNVIPYNLVQMLHFQGVPKIVTIRLGLIIAAVILDTHLELMDGNAMMLMNVVQDLMAVSKHA